MKKRIIICLLAGMLTLSGLLGGCGSKSAQKAQEYKELGITQMEQGEYETATESFQKGLDQSMGKVGAQEMDLCYYKALSQFKSGDMEGAIETYTALIEYDKKNWEAYYLRGSAYLQEEQEKKALADYEKAVSLNEKDIALYTHIYESLVTAGLGDQGESYITQAMKLKVSSAEDYANLGYLYFLKEDYENAQKNLQKSVEEGNDAALLRLGQVYARKNETDQAKACFEKYMEKYPKDVQAMQQLGEMAMNLEEYADAVGYFEKALELAEKKETQNIWRNLIAACEYSGDFERAYKEAGSYLRDYPKDESMTKEYEFLKTRISGKEE